MSFSKVTTTCSEEPTETNDESFSKRKYWSFAEKTFVNQSMMLELKKSREKNCSKNSVFLGLGGKTNSVLMMFCLIKTMVKHGSQLLVSNLDLERCFVNCFTPLASTSINKLHLIFTRLLDSNLSTAKCSRFQFQLCTLLVINFTNLYINQICL